MTKIAKSGEYLRINIPQPIIDLTGWKEGTELMLIPYLKDPHDQITPDTPIIIKAIKEKKRK